GHIFNVSHPDAGCKGICGKAAEKFFGSPASGGVVLVEQGLHEQVIDRVQLFVGVQGGQQILSVLVDHLQDHQAVVGVIFVLSLRLGGEKRLILLPVVLQRVDEFQHD